MEKKWYPPNALLNKIKIIFIDITICLVFKIGPIDTDRLNGLSETGKCLC